MSESIKSGQSEGSNESHVSREVRRLTEAAKNGQLSERVNLAAFSGDEVERLRGSQRLA